MSELLAEREGIVASRSTVRCLLVAAGLHAAEDAGQRQPRQRRARSPRAGMPVQAGGSAHAWLAGRGPQLTRLACIDDATGAAPAARFHPVGDAHGSCLLLRQRVTAAGRPLALCHDRRGIFQVTPERARSGQGPLAGHPEPTRFGRLLGELGSAPSAAQSPQAKGRGARLFRALQGRPVVELRLAAAATLAEANARLATYLPAFNARFAVPASESGSAYRPLDPALPPDALFCFRYRRAVAADNTVRFAAPTLQLVPSVQRLSRARAAVEVRERLDGGTAICHRGARLPSTPAPPPASAATWPAEGSRETPSPPTAAPPAPPPKPAPDHPWRRGTRARR